MTSFQEPKNLSNKKPMDVYEFILKNDPKMRIKIVEGFLKIGDIFRSKTSKFSDIQQIYIYYRVMGFGKRWGESPTDPYFQYAYLEAIPKTDGEKSVEFYERKLKEVGFENEENNYILVKNF